MTTLVKVLDTVGHTKILNLKQTPWLAAGGEDPLNPLLTNPLMHDLLQIVMVFLALTVVIGTTILMVGHLRGNDRMMTTGTFLSLAGGLPFIVMTFIQVIDRVGEAVTITQLALVSIAISLAVLAFVAIGKATKK